MKRNRRVLLWVGVAIVLAVAIGLAGNNGSRGPLNMEKTFDIGHLVRGEFTSLGTLRFDASNSGTLSVTGSGTGAQQLQQAWDDIADDDVLSIRRSVMTLDEDGDEEMELIGVDIARDSEEYPAAVMEYLSWKHGLFGTEVETQ